MRAITCWPPISAATAAPTHPLAVGAYTVAELAADVVGLLDDVGAEQAVLVGHDFGAVVAWTAPLLHPDRFSAVAGLSLPPVPRPRVPTTQAFRRIFGDNFFYILYFQEPGPADAELAADPGDHTATVVRDPGRRRRRSGAADARARTRGFPRPHPRTRAGCPNGSAKTDFDVYVDEFTRNGFTGPLNWYRCFDRNWELTADTAGGDDRGARPVRRRHQRRHPGVHAAPPRPRGRHRPVPRGDDRRAPATG